MGWDGMGWDGEGTHKDEHAVGTLGNARLLESVTDDDEISLGLVEA